MNFYKIVLDEGKKKKYAQGLLLEKNQLEKNICNNCGREFIREPLLDKDSILSVAFTNNNYPDYVFLLYNILISENAKKIMSIEKITGYQIKEINVVSKKDIPISILNKFQDIGYKIKNIPDSPPTYYRLLVNRSAQLHPKSNVVLKEKCDFCGYEKYEKIGDIFEVESISKDSWNGEDLFMVKEFAAVVYCTERFVNMYNNYSLKGLKFEPIQSY